MSPILASTRPWAEAALGLLFPPVCVVCGQRRADPAEGLVCAECQMQVRFLVRPFCERCGLPYPGQLPAAFVCANCHGLELHFSFARSAVAAEGMVLELIHRYKYHQHLWLEPFLAKLLIRQAAEELRAGGWTRIVPVPLHPVKEREREFNQALRLGACLARAVGIPLDGRALRRVQPTRTQTQLTRTQRAENVRRAFVAPAAARLKGERVVVVDDVFTTGATTSACARQLRDAGAAEVCVWTLARGV